MFALSLGARKLRSRVGCGLVVLCAFGALPAVASACTDSWKSAVSGSWATASDWSTGVPVSTDDVCITVAGTYTVTVPGIAAQANSLTLGASSGTQTLDVQGASGGNGIGTGSCVVTMSAAQNVKALFIQVPPWPAPLTVSGWGVLFLSARVT